MDLGKDLSKAVESAKLITRGYVEAAHAIIQMVLILVGGAILKTSKVYMQKFNPGKIEDMEEELFDKYLGVMNIENPEEFDKVILHIKKIEPNKKTCPNCNKEMLAKNITRHLKTCVTGSVCPICQKGVDGDIKAHIESCGRKDYPCHICDEPFNTGARRTAHEKKCRAPGDAGPSKRARFDNDDTAIGGLFRIITVASNISSADYEGALLDELDHIEDILDSRMETGLKFYLSLD